MQPLPPRIEKLALGSERLQRLPTGFVLQPERLPPHFFRRGAGLAPKDRQFLDLPLQTGRFSGQAGQIAIGLPQIPPAAGKPAQFAVPHLPLPGESGIVGVRRQPPSAPFLLILQRLPAGAQEIERRLLPFRLSGRRRGFPFGRRQCLGRLG